VGASLTLLVKSIIHGFAILLVDYPAAQQPLMSQLAANWEFYVLLAPVPSSI